MGRPSAAAPSSTNAPAPPGPVSRNFYETGHGATAYSQQLKTDAHIDRIFTSPVARFPQDTNPSTCLAPYGTWQETTQYDHPFGHGLSERGRRETSVDARRRQRMVEPETDPNLRNYDLLSREPWPDGRLDLEPSTNAHHAKMSAERGQARINDGGRKIGANPKWWGTDNEPHVTYGDKINLDLRAKEQSSDWHREYHLLAPDVPVEEVAASPGGSTDETGRRLRLWEEHDAVGARLRWHLKHCGRVRTDVTENSNPFEMGGGSRHHPDEMRFGQDHVRGVKNVDLSMNYDGGFHVAEQFPHLRADAGAPRERVDQETVGLQKASICKKQANSQEHVTSYAQHFELTPEAKRQSARAKEKAAEAAAEKALNQHGASFGSATLGVALRYRPTGQQSLGDQKFKRNPHDHRRIFSDITQNDHSFARARPVPIVDIENVRGKKNVGCGFFNPGTEVPRRESGNVISQESSSMVNANDIAAPPADAGRRTLARLRSPAEWDSPFHIGDQFQPEPRVSPAIAAAAAAARAPSSSLEVNLKMPDGDSPAGAVRDGRQQRCSAKLQSSWLQEQRKNDVGVQIRHVGQEGDARFLAYEEDRQKERDKFSQENRPVVVGRRRSTLDADVRDGGLTKDGGYLVVGVGAGTARVRESGPGNDFRKRNFNQTLFGEEPTGTSVVECLRPTPGGPEPPAKENDAVRSTAAAERPAGQARGRGSLSQVEPPASSRQILFYPEQADEECECCELPDARDDRLQGVTEDTNIFILGAAPAGAAGNEDAPLGVVLDDGDCDFFFDRSCSEDTLLRIAQELDILDGLMQLPGVGSRQSQFQEPAGGTDTVKRGTSSSKTFYFEEQILPNVFLFADEADGGANEADGDADEADGDANEADGVDANEADGVDANEADGDANEADGDANEADGDANEADGDANEADGVDANEADGDANEADGDANEADGDDSDGLELAEERRRDPDDPENGVYTRAEFRAEYADESEEEFSHWYRSLPIVEEEKRVDPADEDGVAYTRLEFYEFYKDDLDETQFDAWFKALPLAKRDKNAARAAPADAPPRDVRKRTRAKPNPQTNRLRWQLQKAVRELKKGVDSAETFREVVHELGSSRATRHRDGTRTTSPSAGAGGDGAMPASSASYPSISEEALKGIEMIEQHLLRLPREAVADTTAPPPEDATTSGSNNIIISKPLQKIKKALAKNGRPTFAVFIARRQMLHGTPGPGAYASPHKQLKQAPRYSICITGPRIPDRLGRFRRSVPGPGSYYIENSRSRNVALPSPWYNKKIQSASYNMPETAEDQGQIATWTDCPGCGRYFPEDALPAHLNRCHFLHRAQNAKELRAQVETAIESKAFDLTMCDNYYQKEQHQHFPAPASLRGAGAASGRSPLGSAVSRLSVGNYDRKDASRDEMSMRADAIAALQGHDPYMSSAGQDHLMFACKFCARLFPDKKSALLHQKCVCDLRPVCCKYFHRGCRATPMACDLAIHEGQCAYRDMGLRTRASSKRQMNVEKPSVLAAVRVSGYGT